MLRDAFIAPFEVKFADGGEPGEFTGYASVFGNVDSHGDVVVPGAFADTLAEHKARGTLPAMFVEHGPALGGDRLPAGVWREIEEDEHGLRVKGKISALDSDYGRRIYGLVKDRALGALSIGYAVRPAGVKYREKPSDPRRQLKSVNLFEISIVRDASNGLARLDGVKTVLAVGDHDAARAAVADAINLHQQCMLGGDSPNVEERGQMFTRLQDAHEALTGMRMPLGGKSSQVTVREIETALREVGFSRSQAEQFAAFGLKSLFPSRDETRAPQAAPPESKHATEAVDELRSVLSGFSLPSLR